ncbi:MAG: hypothetical protein VX700_10350 [Pseudomonadota bacterium]|nr:hypothetical protein [Pseudomonadota bacterium]
MTGSRNRYLAYACLAVAHLLPVSAAAQLQLNRPPPKIEKSLDVLSPDQPVSSQSASEVTPSTIETVAPRPMEETGIVVNTLTSLDPDANGLLSENQGGFAPNLWRGTDWAVVKALIPRIPSGSSSAVLRSLAVRLLTSRAAVPANKPADASFISLRVDRLLAMGRVGQALALLKVAGNERLDENLARTRIESLFFNNNNAGACKAAQVYRDKYPGLYWAQTQAFCLALSGDHPRAALIADLILEREDEIEPVFFTAIDALAGARKDGTPVLKTPAALHLAMMRAAKLRVPAEIVQDGAVSVLRAVALSPNAALEVRLISAEKAYRAGALTDNQMLRMYLAIPFSREEMKAPISAAEENWGPRSRALILRSAAMQSVPLARAEVLRRAWQIGREHDNAAEIVGPSVPLAAELTPAVELSWFAGDVARTLFAGGRIERAMAWYRIVARDREISDEARAAEAALWPLAILADTTNTVPLSEKHLMDWYAGKQKSDPQTAAKQARTLFSLIGSLGRPISLDIRQSLLNAPFGGEDTGLNVAWQSWVDSASTRDRLGETVLLSTVGAGESVDGILKLGDTLRVINALRGAGLELDAQLLAIETALSSGL